MANPREHAVRHASRLPIVLCCAEDSELALGAVVDALRDEGFAPEVLSGVELDPGLLTSTVDRVREPAVFVLCQGDRLDRGQVRRLEGLFSARKGPQHCMVTVELPRRPGPAVVEVVRAAARDMSRGSPDPDLDDGHYMRDVVMPSSVAAVPGATVPARAAPSRAPAAPVVPSPEGISDEALGLSDDGDTEVVDPLELERGPQGPSPDVQIATDAHEVEAERSFGDGVPLEVPDDYPVVGESSQDVEIRGAPGRLGWDHSGPVEVERVARPPHADPRAEADDRPLPSASSPIEIGVPPPAGATPEAPRRGARVLLLLVAATGMLGVVTMAVLHATAPVGVGPGRGMVERRVPAAAHDPADGAPEPRDRPAVAVAAGPVEGGNGAHAGSGSDGPATTDPGDELAGGTATSDGGTEAEAPPLEGASPGAQAEPGETLEAGDDAQDPAPEGTVKMVPPPPSVDASREQLEAAIEAAVADGRLHAVDPLLALPTGPGTITWDEASRRCKRRTLEGLRSWRLPSKAQLVQLRRAQVLTSGTYWSRTAVGDDEVYVLDATTGRMDQSLKIEPNARAICVRKRP